MGKELQYFNIKIMEKRLNMAVFFPFYSSVWIFRYRHIALAADSPSNAQTRCLPQSLICFSNYHLPVNFQLSKKGRLVKSKHMYIFFASTYLK